jgi:hypothetical protein
MLFRAQIVHSQMMIVVSQRDWRGWHHCQNPKGISSLSSFLRWQSKLRFIGLGGWSYSSWKHFSSWDDQTFDENFVREFRVRMEHLMGHVVTFWWSGWNLFLAWKDERRSREECCYRHLKTLTSQEKRNETDKQTNREIVKHLKWWV